MNYKKKTSAQDLKLYEEELNGSEQKKRILTNKINEFNDKINEQFAAFDELSERKIKLFESEFKLASDFKNQLSEDQKKRITKSRKQKRKNKFYRNEKLYETEADIVNNVQDAGGGIPSSLEGINNKNAA